MFPTVGGETANNTGNEEMAYESLMVFAGNASVGLAENVVKHLGISLGRASVGKFSDGEIAVELLENVRGRDVFILQATCAPTNDTLMELLTVADALKRASAGRITAAIPYFGYARQDRRPRSVRVPISAKLVANMLATAGIDRVLTVDLHADQIQGFFEIPVDHLYASTIFIDYIRELNIENLTIASPDMGGAKRARNYASHLGAEVVIAYKERKKANVIEDMFLIGDVKDRNVILIDDMIDTAGTLCKAADILVKNGAKSVRAIATHGVFSGKAYENIENSALEEVIVTDSIPVKLDKTSKIKVLSCAPLFADVMKSVHSHQSISNKFII